jgi:hypothetical protein
VYIAPAVAARGFFFVLFINTTIALNSRPCLGKNDLFGLLSLGAFFARIISPPIFLHQWTRLKHAEKDGEKHKGTNVAQQSPAAGARRA